MAYTLLLGLSRWCFGIRVQLRGAEAVNPKSRPGRPVRTRHTRAGRDGHAPVLSTEDNKLPTSAGQRLDSWQLLEGIEHDQRTVSGSECD